MYTVLLLEDEVEVLSAMLEVISWETLGFTPPIGAQDGRQGINILKEGYSPDVIITDICMPFVDGLEVAQYAKEHHPEAIVVILTGHDNFQYAQQAVKLGVHEYVLKPITPRKITDLLRQLHDTLQQREIERQDTSEIMRHHFLTRLVTHKLDDSTIQQELQSLNLSFAMPYHGVVVADVDLASPETIEERNQLNLLRFALLNISKELALSIDHLHTFSGPEGLITTIVGGSNAAEVQKKAKEIAELVLVVYQKNLDETASFGIGSSVKDLCVIHKSYKEGIEALETRFHSGSGSVSVYQPPIESEQAFDYAFFERKIQQAAYNFDYEAAETVIQEFAALLAHTRMPFPQALSYTRNLMSALVQTVEKIAHKADHSEMLDYWQGFRFSTVLSLEELKQQMLTLLDKAFIPLHLLGQNQTTIQMSQAEQYIRENYQNSELSLGEITEHLAVSVSYFSANFKSHTGMTFVEYVTKYRMEQAQQMLSMTDLRTYEVAERVGYANPQYFSSSFRKHTGASPKEYRESQTLAEE